MARPDPTGAVDGSSVRFVEFGSTTNRSQFTSRAEGGSHLPSGYLLSRDSDPASVASDQSTHVNPASSLCVLDVWSSPSDVGDHGPGAVLALTRRTSPDWHML